MVSALRPLVVVGLLCAAACGQEGQLDDLGAADATLDGALEASADGASDGSTPDGGPDGSSEVAADAAVEATLDAAPEVAIDPHICPTAATTKDCSPGTGTGEGDQCKAPSVSPSCYLKLAQKAVSDLVSLHPDWFDFVGPSGCPVIKDVGKFLDAVVAALLADGVCAERDRNAPLEEVTVKKTNGFSENFDLVSSAGCARWGDPIYTGYCAPAWW